MASDVETLNTYRDAAITAVAAGDNATALSNARAAAAMLATMPNSTFEGTALTWDREAIQAFIKDCNARIGAAAGIQTTKRVYVRPSAV